jgi:hypothetical protein
LDYRPGFSGKCPHCQHDVYFAESVIISHPRRSWFRTSSGGQDVTVYSSQCPNCKKPIISSVAVIEGNKIERLLHPFNIVRPVPPEVPKTIGEDFLEAAAVITFSEKASAALSRRCLQNVLNDKGFTGRTLSDQIDAVLPRLPTGLAKNVDTIRHIGNFAAHPMKSQSTGIIVNVEPGEANWNLDALEGLFDHFYVRPAIEEAKRKELEKKLADLGKPPLKKP